MKRKCLVFILLVCVMFGTVACTPANEEQIDSASNEVIEDNSGDVDIERIPSVALLLNGPINDMDWCTAGYEGLKQIEEEYGAEISYVESVSLSDAESVLRSFAEGGFDIIFAHSDEYHDAVLAAAEDYPNTQYISVGGSETRDNVTIIDSPEYEAGFLIGATAALLTESDTVGAIAGVKILSVQKSIEGFTAGAKYVNPDIEALTTYTGSWSDATKAKETTYSMVDNNADVVANMLGHAGIAILEAAEERDILSIGTSEAQHTIAPDHVPVIVIKDLPTMFVSVYEKVLDQSLEQTIYRLGTADGAVYPLYLGEVSQELKDDIAKIMDEIVNGNIEL